PGFFGPLPKAEEFAAIIRSTIPASTPLEEVIDRARVIAKEQMFRIGVRILAESVGATDAGGAFSDLADAVLRRLHPAVLEDMLARHGAIAGGRTAIVALGKLGGRE